MTQSSKQGLLNPDAKTPVAETLSEEPESKLSEEDLERVEKYLASPIHQIERKPFKPWLMMLLLVGTVIFLGGLSMLISWLVLG